MVRISLAAAAMSVALLNGGSAQSQKLFPDDPMMVTRGAEIYQQQCASCHAADLSGRPNWRQRQANGRLPALPHDESGHTWHHPDDVLFRLTKEGTAGFLGDPSYPSDMPAYGDILSDLEIIAVLSFIKNQWPEETRKIHDEINAQSQAR